MLTTVSSNPSLILITLSLLLLTLMRSSFSSLDITILTPYIVDIIMLSIFLVNRSMQVLSPHAIFTAIVLRVDFPTQVSVNIGIYVNDEN